MEKKAVMVVFILIALCPVVFVGALTCAIFKLCSPDTYFLYVILPWSGISVPMAGSLYIYSMIKLIRGL